MLAVIKPTTTDRVDSDFEDDDFVRICDKKFITERLKHLDAQNQVNDLKANNKDDSKTASKDIEWVPCTICDEMFENKTERSNHMLSLHHDELAAKGRIYTKGKKLYINWISCDFLGCEKWFPDNTKKQRHFLRTHSNEKNSTCDVCGKAFSCKALQGT